MRCGEVEAERFVTIEAVPIGAVKSQGSATPQLNAQTKLEGEVADNSLRLTTHSTAAIAGTKVSC